MTKLDTEHQPLNFSYASEPDLETTRRFIVPVTSPEADLTAITQRIWELASATGAHVKFIGLCDDTAEEPSLRRTLVTASATMNYGDVTANIEIVFGRDWVGNLKSRLQAGDMVVCWEEQPTGMFRKLMSQLLQSDLGAPLYFLSGFHPQSDSRSNWTIQAAAWIGSIALIIGFLILQIKVTHLAKDWTMILQVLTTIVELWLILTWNNLFR